VNSVANLRAAAAADVARAIRDVRDQLDDLVGYDHLDWEIAKPALRHLSAKLRLAMIIEARRHG
jgi:hypothetical protein